MHRLPPLTSVFLACVTQAQGFVPLTAPLGVPSVPPTTTQFSSGVCVADLDGDGDLDIVVTPPSGGSFVVLRNDGGMVFTDVSAAASLGTVTNPSCILAADIDNDGDEDLFVGRNLLTPLLFINNANFHFVERATARGLVFADDTYGASFGDFDRDGLLDLAVANRQLPSGPGHPNRLYRNTGGGFFTDVTATAGVAGSSFSYCVAWMDFDEDGWPDLLVANDKGSAWGPNRLYRNNGNGTFSDVSAQYGALNTIDGMGIDFIDAFCDGGIDYFCTDDTAHLFNVWDPQLGTYVDSAATFGMTGNTIGWACNFLDYDNDGWPDLHVVHGSLPNFMFHNPGAPVSAQVPWTNTTAALGIGLFYPQRTAAVGDLDDDGRIDILERFDNGSFPPPVGLQLYRNQVTAGNWIRFKARGTVSNRDGFGARIEVLTGTHNQRQWVRSGVGYLSESDHRVHFGVGSATTVDRVTVTWPSGQKQYLTHVPVNQTITLVEPKMTLSGPVAVGGTTTISASLPGDEGLDYLMVLALSANFGIPLPDGAVIPIDYDFLTDLSLQAGPFFPGAVGVIAPNGSASSTLTIPPFPFLSGWTFYSTILTTDQPDFPYARTVMAKALPIPIL